MVKKGKLIIKGNVQSVGYRAYVKKVAVALGVRGNVKNLDDGTVEVNFEAPSEAAYQSFYKKIEKKRKNEEDEFAVHVAGITPTEIRDADKFEFKTPFEVDYGMKLTDYEKENLERQELAIMVLSNFDNRTQESFGIMEQKYGAISKTLEELKNGLLKELAEGIKILSEKQKS